MSAIKHSKDSSQSHILFYLIVSVVINVLHPPLSLSDLYSGILLSLNHTVVKLMANQRNHYHYPVTQQDFSLSTSEINRLLMNHSWFVYWSSIHLEISISTVPLHCAMWIKLMYLDFLSVRQTLYFNRGNQANTNTNKWLWINWGCVVSCTTSLTDY